MTQITSKDLNSPITSAMKDIINKKFIFLEQVAQLDTIKISVAREGSKFTVSARFVLNDKPFKVTSGLEDDAYVAVDMLVASVKEVVRDNRAKFRQKRKTKRTDMLKEFRGIETQEKANAPQIVKRKKFSTKPMTEDAAIAEMEGLGHDVFVFMNSEVEGKICMIYTRNDEGYGLIELD